MSRPKKQFHDIRCQVCEGHELAVGTIAGIRVGDACIEKLAAIAAAAGVEFERPTRIAA